MAGRNDERSRVVRWIQTESAQLNPGPTIVDERDVENQSNAFWIVDPRDAKAHVIERGGIVIVNALRKMRMREIEHSRVRLPRALRRRCLRQRRAPENGPDSQEPERSNELPASRAYGCTVLTMIGVVIISTVVISISVSSRSKLPLKGTATS